MTSPAITGARRIRAVMETALLDSPAEKAFDRLTRLATMTLEIPTAMVSLVTADRQFFKSCVGVREPWASRRDTPMQYSRCQYVVTCDGYPLGSFCAIDYKPRKWTARGITILTDLAAATMTGIELRAARRMAQPQQ